MTSVAAPAPAVPSASKTGFERTMDSLDISKQDINELVMNFLIQEGCPEAATRFAEEAKLKYPQDTDIEARVRIRDAIYQGDIESAIEQVNDVDHELLDNNKPLHFALLRLQLIELIKKIFAATEAEKPQLVGDAINFAQQNLAPYAPANEQFKNDLEQAMALLIIPKEAWQNATGGADSSNTFGPLSTLVSPSLRIEVAKDLNGAILRSKDRSDQTRIHTILQTRAWAESLAKANEVELPANMTISFSGRGANRAENDNSNGGDTQMTEDEGETARTDAVARYTDLP